MNVTYEHKNELTFIGFHTEIAPDGLDLFTFPESDWAIFAAKGPIPQSLQTLNTQVWNEWAPNIKTMYEVGSSSLEIYSAMNPQSPDYECGIWVPIQKKSDIKICQSCGMPMESEDVIPQNNACELYFEEENVDEFFEKLKALYPETEFVNLPMTHSWGQKVVRFYDPGCGGLGRRMSHGIQNAA